MTSRPYPRELVLKNLNLLKVQDRVKSDRTTYLTWLQRTAVNKILGHFLQDSTDAFKPTSAAFLLADDTGLGKTRINLAVADYVARNVGGPVLLIVPNGEVHRKTLSEAAVLGIAASDYLNTIRSIIDQDATKVTLSGIFLIRISIFSQPSRRFPDLYLRNWSLIVFDESHMMKPIRNSWVISGAQANLPVSTGDNIDALNQRLKNMAQRQQKTLQSTGRNKNLFAVKTTNLARKESMRRINLALLIDETHVLFSSATPFERLAESELVLSKFFELNELGQRLKNINQTIDFLRENGAIISRVLPFWGTVRIVSSPWTPTSINNDSGVVMSNNDATLNSMNQFYSDSTLTTLMQFNQKDMSDLLQAVRASFAQIVQTTERFVPILTRLTFETEVVEYLKSPYVALRIMKGFDVNETSERNFKYIVVTEFVQNQKFLVPISLNSPTPDNIPGNHPTNESNLESILDRINTFIFNTVGFIWTQLGIQRSLTVEEKSNISLSILSTASNSFLEIPSATTFFTTVFPKDFIVSLFGINNPQNLQRSVRSFNADPKRRILIMTTRTGGTGIDLDDQTGEFRRLMIVLTFNWSAAMFHQLFGRISRLTTKTPSEIMMLWWSSAELNTVEMRNQLTQISSDINKQIANILTTSSTNINPDIEQRKMAKILNKVSTLAQIRPDISWTDESQIDVGQLQSAPLDVFKSFIVKSLSPTQNLNKRDPRFELVEYDSPAFWMRDDPTWQQIKLIPKIVS
jgi:hypothetical protein